MNTRIKQAIIAAAQAQPAEEVCGLIYQTLEGVHLYPSPNVTRDEEGVARAFELDPQAYIAAAEAGRVLGVYHSHAADGSTSFSEADIEMAQELGLPFYLYCNRDASWHSYVPESYRVPLTGASWQWGFWDCLSVVTIYYRQERAVYLTDYDRDETFEEAGESAITQHIATEGFKQIATNEAPQIGDVLLFRTPGHVYPHHLAVLIGPSIMLHHPRGALSRTDPLDGAWLKRLVGVLRYTGKEAAAV